MFYDHAAYISMTMEFRCNLKCVHCMIEGTMDNLAPQSDAKFQSLLAFNKKARKWRGLILTGAEITLRQDLPALAQAARESGFDHVRIQTHGMKLGQKAYADRLIAAGVDEYFISVAGSDAQSHDEITAVPGAWAKMIQGMHNLDAHEHVTMITNTVVTARSYKLLPDLVRNLSVFRQLKQMEFWVYWPMREQDEKNLIAPYHALVPVLQEAADIAMSQGRRIEIKNVPECLLGAHGHLLENAQPELHIDPAFWQEFSRNGFHLCPAREQCRSQRCLGFNAAYLEKFAGQVEAVTPLS